MRLAALMIVASFLACTTREPRVASRANGNTEHETAGDAQRPPLNLPPPQTPQQPPGGVLGPARGGGPIPIFDSGARPLAPR
jgi:hypothetical protein